MDPIEILAIEQLDKDIAWLSKQKDKTVQQETKIKAIEALRALLVKRLNKELDIHTHRMK